MLTADRRIDRRILLEADALEGEGWSVTILGMPLDEGEVDRDPRVIRVGGSGSLQLRENLLIHAYRRVRGVLAMNSVVMRGLKAFAWRFVADQERFFTNTFLSDALNHPSDVVIAHDLPMLPAARAAAARFGAKLVYDNHELYAEQEFSSFERRRWIGIERKHIGAADLIIAVNRSIAQELQDRYGIERVEVILNAEHPLRGAAGRDTLRRRLSLSPGAVIGLFQGGLSQGRNLLTLVEAVALMDAPDFHLVFLGDGHLSGALKKKAAALGIAGRVHFLPAVPQADLLDYTASADFGIIPYQPVCLNTYYCTPNKLFEFVAAGLPILASDLPELKRFVEGFCLGAVADLSNARAAAGALSAMATDPARRRHHAGQVVAAQSQISWSIEGQRLVEIMAPLKPATGG